jgi:hypothetical protein
MTPAVTTFAGLGDGSVRSWLESHPDPLVREAAERWAAALDEMDEALRSAIDRAEVAERQLAAVDAARRRERERAELQAQLAPPDPY